MKEPIRILHVVQRMEAGGTQALLMNIYRKIDRTKVQFDFLVEYNEKQFYDDEIIKLGGKIYYTNVRKDYNLLKYKRRLKQILNENDYKIIHVHAFTIGYITLKTAKECGIPIRIAHSHSNEIVRDKKYAIKRVMQKIYSIYATDLFACSEEAGEYLFGDRKFEILKNGIDTSKFEYDETVRKEVRNELNLNNAFVIGHVGRFQPSKNHRLLIDVFNEIRKKKDNAKLVLIGSGPLENEIKSQIKMYNLENDVLFLGNRNDVCRIYQAMDIFLFPSLFEGLGIVAIEAQVSGTPVICSNMLPKEVEITDICKKINLEADKTEWANSCLKFEKYEKGNSSQYKMNIINAGFDISNVAQKMQDFYQNKMKNY